jgi:DNA-binding transcriptional MerR regulator
MDKSPEAFRTISEVAQELGLPQHVLRFWETRFSQIRPLKRGGGRRYYRPPDVLLLKTIRHLLYGEGYTIKGVQRLLKEKGAKEIAVLIENGAERLPAQPVGPVADDELDADTAAADEASPDGHEVPESGIVPGRAEPPPAASGEGMPAAKSPRPITRRDLDRLRAALMDLAECERVLAAARAL